MEEITLSIDCYQCGNKLEFQFRPFVSHAAYCYCPECQEGIQVYMINTTLHIDRLQQE